MDEKETSTDPAEENRRKLAEHLANMAKNKGKPAPKEKPREAGANEAQGTGGPTMETRWDAWKRLHGGRVHTFRKVEPAEVADARALKTLGLQPGATETEIKRAFYKFAKANHPDQGGDAEVFQKYLGAYRTLGGKD